MAMHDKLPIYKVCYDLLTLSSGFIRHMPRDFKRTIGEQIFLECTGMVLLIARANAARDKAPHIQALTERLETARMLIRLAHDIKALSHSAHAHAIELMAAIGRQAGGWLRSVQGHHTAAPAA